MHLQPLQPPLAHQMRSKHACQLNVLPHAIGQQSGGAIHRLGQVLSFAKIICLCIAFVMLALLPAQKPDQQESGAGLRPE